MEQPTYLKRLAHQKVLLIIGVLVALIAGLVAGFTIKDGEIVSRVEKSFTAASNILVTDPQPTLFQSTIPGGTQVMEAPADDGSQVVQEPDTEVNLSTSALLMAYVAQSDEVKNRTATAAGGFEEGEGITAVARTTQPIGDERFPGRLTLPIVQIVAFATSAERATELSALAGDAFQQVVVENQDAEEIPESIRITLDVINAPVAGEGEGSNPAIPIVITFFAVFLLFVAAALIIEAVRARRRSSDPDGAGADEAEADGDASDESDEFDEFLAADDREPEWAGAGTRTRIRSRASSGAGRDSAESSSDRGRVAVLDEDESADDTPRG